MDVSQDPPTQPGATQEQPVSAGIEYEEIDFEAAFEAIKSYENYQGIEFLIISLLIIFFF